MSDRIAVMSSGEVQQIGSPRDIYEAPVNRFVADFIGETNLLEAEVLSVEDGVAHCTLTGGQHLFCVTSDATARGRHHVSIRPERLTVCAAAAADLTGTVERLVYLGTDLQAVIAIAGGARVTIRIQNSAETETPATGDTVGLKVEAGAARLLAD